MTNLMSASQYLVLVYASRMLLMLSCWYHGGAESKEYS